MSQFLFEASTWVIPVLFAITLHEAAHGLVAWRLGDDTAHRAGRVTANPIRHVDPVGTLVVPGMLLLVGSGFLFGWAKPVPVRFDRLRAPKRDMVLVALAGPGANILLALVSAALLHILPLVPQGGQTWTAQTLIHSLQLNLVLAVFNMLPLPPLDGGRVVTGLLPGRLAQAYARLEPAGFPILITLIIILPMFAADVFGTDFNPLAEVILPAVRSLSELALIVVGLRP